MKVLLLALAFVLVASFASAQTHPCDAPPVVNPALTSPIIVQICHSNKDVNGSALTLTSWEVTIDSTILFTGALTPVGAASAVSGLTLYETAPLTPAVSPVTGANVGPHTVTVRATATAAAGPSAASTTYPFQIVALPTPSKPTVVGVRK